jgi:antitoxin PrlF
VPLRGGIGGSANQHWFWEPEWQAGERDADEQIKAGDVEVFGDVNAMFAALSS